VLPLLISQIQYIHSRDIVHNDIRLRHFLLRGNYLTDFPEGSIVLIDYGLAGPYSKDNHDFKDLTSSILKSLGAPRPPFDTARFSTFVTDYVSSLGVDANLTTQLRSKLLAIPSS